jgi:hypothetical protein
MKDISGDFEQPVSEHLLLGLEYGFQEPVVDIGSGSR